MAPFFGPGLFQLSYTLTLCCCKNPKTGKNSFLIKISRMNEPITVFLKQLSSQSWMRSLCVHIYHKIRSQTIRLCGVLLNTCTMTGILGMEIKVCHSRHHKGHSTQSDEYDWISQQRWRRVRMTTRFVSLDLSNLYSVSLCFMLLEQPLMIFPDWDWERQKVH